MPIANIPVSVSIDGSRLHSFKSLRLEQRIGQHHRFELVIDLETGRNRLVHNLTDSAAWLGKPIAVEAGTQGSPSFLGVVTNVTLRRRDSDFGCIAVTGYSRTYLLETKPGHRSWVGQTLDRIVGELAGRAGVDAAIRPEYREGIPYECQYGESDFDFIRRLARQHKEWLYYDGTAMVFGKPDKPEPMRLEFGSDLATIDIGVQTLARPSRVVTYHSGMDMPMDEPTPDKPIGQDFLGYQAFEASMGLFREPSYCHAEPRINSMKELEDYVVRLQAAETAESHYITCTSERNDLRVGSVIDLKSSFREGPGRITSESLGEYIITEITHTVGEDCYYRNQFHAIPASTPSLPVPDVPMPVAHTQMATVVSNADPSGKGRVQVRMNWQKEGMQTNWIRVMTPDGGASGEVSKNRGFVFIPEKGDQVLVGFRRNDPNRPYVMGSLFNGTTGAGGGEGNKCKSLTTRSGSSLKLDDSDGSVTLNDKKQKNKKSVELAFDGKGNSTITANATHNVKAGTKISFDAGADKETPDGKSYLKMDSEGVIDLSGNTRITIKVGESKIEIDNTTITLNAQNILVQGSNATRLGTGGQQGIAITQAGNVDIIGSPVNINQEKGGKVNIK